MANALYTDEDLLRGNMKKNVIVVYVSVQIRSSTLISHRIAEHFVESENFALSSGGEMVLNSVLKPIRTIHLHKIAAKAKTIAIIDDGTRPTSIARYCVSLSPHLADTGI